LIAAHATRHAHEFAVGVDESEIQLVHKTMMILRQLAAEPPAIPTRAAWYLADLGEARGKQELFTRQSPQKLKLLREHALIESAVSSNRFE
jgi:hypothetical protein